MWDEAGEVHFVDRGRKVESSRYRFAVWKGKETGFSQICGLWVDNFWSMSERKAGLQRVRSWQKKLSSKIWNRSRNRHGGRARTPHTHTHSDPPRVSNRV